MRTLASAAQSVRFARQALRSWTPRRVGAAALAAMGVALAVGVPTVLIPNPVFGREIAPVWWNYPIWIATSILSGLLLATYVRPSGSGAVSDTGGAGVNGAGAHGAGSGGSAGDEAEPDTLGGEDDRRTRRIGTAGALLAWFAVGCPVCNKVALLALGYSGALTWFAPAQPVLAAAAVLATSGALVTRLRGQVACALGPVAAATSSRERAPRGATRKLRRDAAEPTA